MTKDKKLIIRTIAPEKFNNNYIKKNSKVLFIYDTKVNVGEGINKFKENKNTLGLDFSKIKDDDDKKSDENKKIIDSEIKKLVSKAKSYKDVVMCTNKIGLDLVKDKKSSYLYLRVQLRKYESTISPMKKTKKKGKDNSSSNNSLQSLNKKKNKISKKNKSLAHKQAMHKIKNKLKESYNVCEICNKKSIKELNKPIELDKSGRYRKRVKKLRNCQLACDRCLRRCNSIKKYMKYVNKDSDLIKSRYPLLCRKDHSGKSKAERLTKQIRTAIKTQYEVVNQQ